MLTFWRKPSLFREGLAALICALVLLAGVVQARAGTEQAAKSGFASVLALCQQKSQSGDGPEPDTNCDHCRLPMPLATGAPEVISTLSARVIVRSKLCLPDQGSAQTGRTLLPEARGPPMQG
ncbi:MAG: hypothetical protein J0L51_03290 [Rhizobiales bacterium]|nr:hypothetical protein [Hyphomicrobiales bacterium]